MIGTRKTHSFVVWSRADHKSRQPIGSRLPIDGRCSRLSTDSGRRQFSIGNYSADSVFGSVSVLSFMPVGIDRYRSNKINGGSFVILPPVPLSSSSPFASVLQNSKTRHYRRPFSISSLPSSPVVGGSAVVAFFVLDSPILRRRLHSFPVSNRIWMFSMIFFRNS